MKQAAQEVIDWLDNMDANRKAMADEIEGRKMKREDIIRMAREVGFEELFKNSHDWVCFTEEIERFFQAAYAAGAAAEREACAKVCDDIDIEYEGEDVLATWCAAAIRARSNT